MESAGEARPGIWIATTECWVRRAAWHHCTAAGRVSTSTHHTLSCTNLDLSRVTTREEGSTLCSVGIRLTSSRVVPPYTSYTGHTVAAAAAW